MKTKLVSGLVILAVWMAVGFAVPVSAGSDQRADQLDVARAEQIARAYLSAHLEDLGLVATDLQDVVLRSRTG